MECSLVLVGEEPGLASANLLLDHLLGAEIFWTTKAKRDETLQSVFDAKKNGGKKPYLIPYGGSNVTGAAAYALALKELHDQDIEPDRIVFASSSGGTQAGLLAGASLLQFRGKILGISVDEPAIELKSRVTKLADETIALLGGISKTNPRDVFVNDDYLGGGYAIMGDREQEAIRMFAQLEGILVDPVYTGRAAAGMIDLIRKQYFKKGERILFWHTGGTPAIFAEAYQKDLS
jgi:1-aminocyclopropane-1-carboxylate deaminase/D-cysteine desulfhydrase-like pyridoxal-dependent ACC family enzyme